MEAAAHNPAFAKKAGIPVSVAQEFSKADKGKKFKDGGMAHLDIKEDKKLIKRAFRMHDEQEHQGKHTNLSKLKKGGLAMKKTFKDMEKREVEFMRKKGAPSTMIKHEKAEMSEEKGEPMCGGGKVKKMAKGGKVKRMAIGGLGAASAFGNNPIGGIRGALDAGVSGMTPAYGSGDSSGGAMGGLNNVYSGAGQIGQSLGTIQGALGVGGGAQQSPLAGSPQEMYKKGGKVMKMAKGGSVKEARMLPSKMEKIPQGNKKFGEHVDQKKGHTKGKEERGYKTEEIQGGAKGGKKVFGAAPIKMATGGRSKVDPKALAAEVMKQAPRPAVPPMAVRPPMAAPAVSPMTPTAPRPMKKGGATKKYSAGGSVSSASKRGDGCAIRGKTRA